MMYFCHYTFEASKHPKFLDKAIAMLMQAEGKVFLDENDVEMLGYKVSLEVSTSSPGRSDAFVSYGNPAKGQSCISVYAKRSDGNSVGRALFKPIKDIVTYDLDKKDFVHVEPKEMEVQNEEERNEAAGK